MVQESRIGGASYELGAGPPIGPKIVGIAALIPHCSYLYTCSCEGMYARFHSTSSSDRCRPFTIGTNEDLESNRLTSRTHPPTPVQELLPRSVVSDYLFRCHSLRRPVHSQLQEVWWIVIYAPALLDYVLGHGQIQGNVPWAGLFVAVHWD